jgi:hypothetical protein
MGISIDEGETRCRIVFEGEITDGSAREFENLIIGALRRYRHLDIDLSGITEIDLWGLHLLGVLRHLGGPHAVVVADSMVVQQATQRLMKTARGSFLRGTRHEREAHPYSA